MSAGKGTIIGNKIETTLPTCEAKVYSEIAVLVLYPRIHSVTYGNRDGGRVSRRTFVDACRRHIRCFFFLSQPHD